MFCLDGTGSPLRCDGIANINIFVNFALSMYHVVFVFTFLFMFCSCATTRLLPLLKQLGNCALGMYDFVSMVSSFDQFIFIFLFL
jgi:hypothetical protein